MDLPTSLQDQLDSLLDESEIAFAKQDYETCIGLYQQGWNLLPTPKEQYDDSYAIAEGLIIQNMLLNRLAEAHRWATILVECDTDRIDGGEREMWFGKIAYEQHDTEQAMRYFKTAFRKSEGRRFLESGNEKYYTFYLAHSTPD